MATAEIAHAVQIEHAAKGTQRFYRPELDALRFGAFLAVYVCHSIPNEAVAGALAPGNTWIGLLSVIKDAGNFGVCLFFMLSSFLITELMRREFDAYRHIHIGAFYLRRMLRIWPLYFGVTITYVLGGHYFPSMRMEPGRVLAYFLLAGNWYIAFHPWIQTPLRSLWSISVEEQFYLVWPLLAYVGGLRMIAKAGFAIMPFSLIAIIIASSDKAYAYNTVWLNSFTQFQFFAWGGLLALALNGSMPKFHHAVRDALGVGGAVLWLLAAYATGIKRPGAEVSSAQFCCGYLLVAAGCLLLLLATLGTKWRIPRWLAYLGKISFGLYVFHEAAFLLVDEAQKHMGVLFPVLLSWASQHFIASLAINKVIALGATILLAMLSYRFWETPFLRFKRRVTWVQSRSV